MFCRVERCDRQCQFDSRLVTKTRFGQIQGSLNPASSPANHHYCANLGHPCRRSSDAPGLFEFPSFRRSRKAFETPGGHFKLEQRSAYDSNVHACQLDGIQNVQIHSVSWNCGNFLLRETRQADRKSRTMPPNSSSCETTDSNRTALGDDERISKIVHHVDQNRGSC